MAKGEIKGERVRWLWRGREGRLIRQAKTTMAKLLYSICLYSDLALLGSCFQGTFYFLNEILNQTYVTEVFMVEFLRFLMHVSSTCDN